MRLQDGYCQGGYVSNWDKSAVLLRMHFTHRGGLGVRVSAPPIPSRCAKNKLPGILASLPLPGATTHRDAKRPPVEGGYRLNTAYEGGRLGRLTPNGFHYVERFLQPMRASAKNGGLQRALLSSASARLKIEWSSNSPGRDTYRACMKY